MTTRAGLLALGKRFGFAGQLVTQQALYAQRCPCGERPASIAASQQPAVGIGKHSVFDGVKRALHPGAPILRQYSS